MPLSLVALPWLLLFPAALWFVQPFWKRVGLIWVVLGLALAVWAGQLKPIALLPIVALCFVGYGMSRWSQRGVQWSLHALFVLLALALCLHALPGFNNPKVIGPVRFTPDAMPFTMYLNVDKSLVGFWLLAIFPWIDIAKRPRAIVLNGMGAWLGTTAICLGIALATGLIAWAPKWPPLAWLWAVNNLLLVSLTEEALFRGYIQGGLNRLFARYPLGELIALLVSALMFGCAHAAGGWRWVLVASCAGVGYGIAYRRGGLLASIGAHFGLNLVHFCLFTYPMLAG